MSVVVRLLALLRSLGDDSPDPRRCASVWSARIEPARAARTPKGLILGTGVLVYRRMDLASVPKSRRRAAVAAQLRAWSPFPRSDFRVVWFGDSAGAFAWDADRLARRLADAELSAGRLPVLPEPWLYPVAEGLEGPRLVRHAEGFAGEVWAKRDLRALRWWPAEPGGDDWSNFLRGAGLAPAGVPAPITAKLPESTTQLRGRPALLTEAELRTSAAGLDTALALAASLALMGGTAFLAADQLELNRQREAAQTRLEQLQARSGPVVAAREAALGELASANQLAAMLQGPRALAVLEHLTARLTPVQGLVLRQLDLNGRQLRITLEVPTNLERSRIVTALEEGGWFTDVREARESAANQLGLTMTLRGDQPAARPLPASASVPTAPSPAPSPAATTAGAVK